MNRLAAWWHALCHWHRMGEVVGYDWFICECGWERGAP